MTWYNSLDESLDNNEAINSIFLGIRERMQFPPSEIAFLSTPIQHICNAEGQG